MLRHPSRYRKKIPGAIKILIMAFVVLGLAVIMVEITLRPIFAEIAEAQAVRIMTEIINSAVKKHCLTLTYDDLIFYEKNAEGRIMLMQPNVARINTFSVSVWEEVHNNLANIKTADIKIPLAQLLGIKVLAGLGPQIKLDMVPFGFTEPPVINDVFESVGINQTRHRIYVKFPARVKVIIPFMSQVVEVDYEAPVSEVTIVGEVPKVYVNLNEGILGEAMGAGKQ